MEELFDPYIAAERLKAFDKEFNRRCFYLRDARRRILEAVNQLKQTGKTGIQKHSKNVVRNAVRKYRKAFIEICKMNELIDNLR